MITAAIDPLSDGQWMKFISSQAEANIRYHPAWLRVISGQYNIAPQAFCSYKNGIIVSGFIFMVSRGMTGNKFAVTASSSDSNLFLGSENNQDELLHDFLKHLKQLKISRVEFRDNINSTSLFSLLMGYSHSLNINAGIGAIGGSSSSKPVARNIRKAENAGLICEIRDDLNSLEEFYALHVKTRKKLGMPVQSRNFFVKYRDEIIKAGMGYIVLVKKDNITLSAGLFAGYNSTLSYKFGASHPDLLQYRPNNLMLWGALLEAQKRGFGKFDMGRTEHTNDGLRRFKMGWGCSETPVRFSYYPGEPKSRFLQKANILFVHPVIRISPEYVCRIAGKLVYKLFPLQFV